MKKKEQRSKYEKPKREVLSREEIIKRMQDFPKRRDKIIAAIRKVKD